MRIDKPKITVNDCFLIGMNLVPLFGVLFRNWDPKQMFLIYCMESVILGLYAILRMMLVTFYKKHHAWDTTGGHIEVSGWFYILFFILHYGLFLVVQLIIFGAVSGFAGEGSFGMFTFILRIPNLLTDQSKLILYGFAFVYGAELIIRFITTEKYKHYSLGLLMFQPYGRIMLQQFVVILGSMFLTFGAGKIFMVVFVGIKILFMLIKPYTAWEEKFEGPRDI